MYTSTHLNAVAREAIEYRVRDARRLTNRRSTTRTPRTRASRPLSLVRRAAHRLA
ncbi:hypothetical protein MU582_13800 [Nocardioidaceae bacterium SCSIO 66511]|nr:hypothetical protein MU582_13800 [Nocardioidaceae bacterium SCSIO 66511]